MQLSSTVSRVPLPPILVVGASVLLGLMLVFSHQATLLLAVTTLLVGMIVFRPAWIPFYLLLVFSAQPLLMRLVPMSSELWPIVKHADEFSLAALFPFALARHVLRRSWPLPKVALSCLAGLLLIGLVGSLIQGTGTYLIVLDAFLLFKGFIAFVIITAVPCGSREARALVVLGAVIALIAALVGLLELGAPELVRGLIPLSRQGERLGMITLISIFNNPGQAGWFFAFFASASFGFYCVYRNNPTLALFLCFATCSVLTLRRKPLGGLAVVLLLSVLLTRQTSQRLRVIVVTLLCVLLLFVSFGDTITAVFDQGYQMYVGSHQPTRVARTAMYIASFKLAAAHFPIGVGFGLFGGYASQLYYSDIYYETGLSTVWGLSPTQNQYLLDAFWPHVIGQFGFIGLLLFLGALIAIWRPVLGVSRQAESRFERGLALAAVFGFTEAFVESTAMGVFEATLPSFCIFGIAGLVFALRDRQQTPEPGQVA